MPFCQLILLTLPCPAHSSIPTSHWCKKKFRRIKIAFGLRSSCNTMEIDGALFWYLRNFFGDFTHLNCPSLCYNSKLIITDTFLHFSLNKLQPFVVVVTCFENFKRNKVATKVKTFKYRKTIFNSQVVINLHCSGNNLGDFDNFWTSWTDYNWCQVFGNPERNLSSRISKRVQNAKVTRFFKNLNIK